MSENFDVIKEMEEAQETVNSYQHQGGDAGTVRKAVTTVMIQLGINNRIEDVRLDNYTWQVNFTGRLDKEQREVIADLTTEQLGIIGIKPKTIKMVGLYSRK